MAVKKVAPPPVDANAFEAAKKLIPLSGQKRTLPIAHGLKVSIF